MTRNDCAPFATESQSQMTTATASLGRRTSLMATGTVVAPLANVESDGDGVSRVGGDHVSGLSPSTRSR